MRKYTDDTFIYISNWLRRHMLSAFVSNLNKLWRENKYSWSLRRRFCLRGGIVLGDDLLQPWDFNHGEKSAGWWLLISTRAKKSLLRTNDLAAGPHEFLTDRLCACNGRQKQSEGLPELLASWQPDLVLQCRPVASEGKKERVRGFMEMCWTFWGTFWRWCWERHALCSYARPCCHS